MSNFPKADERTGSYSGRSSMGENRSPVLPFGRVNPAKQTHSEDGFLDGEGFHVLQTRDGKFRAANIGSGSYVYWNVGETVYLMHDQTRRDLGPRSGYRVVGTILANGETDGVVPDKTMPVVVFK